MSTPARYFAPDYRTARERFRAAARAAGAELDAWVFEVRGPDGGALSTDVAWLGSRAPRRVLLHVSGIHGVEGFAGSAVQIRALETPPALGDESALALVHVLNPYGMAWLRRSNENNVDLNRNSQPPDFSWSGAPEAYRRLDPLLNPRSPPRRDAFVARLCMQGLRMGPSRVRGAIAGGQYDYPQGLFFGGQGPQPQLLHYRAWLGAALRGVQRIFVVDFHTGLGRFAHSPWFYYPLGHDGSDLPVSLAKRVTRSFEKSSSGGYPVQGGHERIYAELFEQLPIDFITQEIGTYSGFTMLTALRSENRQHHFGDGRVDHPAKRRLLDSANPPSVRWQAAALDAGMALIETAADYLQLAGQPRTNLHRHRRSRSALALPHAWAPRAHRDRR